jgi:hypothetical protein
VQNSGLGGVRHVEKLEKDAVEVCKVAVVVGVETDGEERGLDLSAHTLVARGCEGRAKGPTSDRAVTLSAPYWLPPGDVLFFGSIIERSTFAGALTDPPSHPKENLTMFEDLLSEFTSSKQAQDAMGALAAKGYSAPDAQKIIAEALPAAKEAMEQQTASHPKPEVGLFNLFGGHAGKEFLIGLMEGVARGDGVMGSLEDGGMSMIAGHIGEVIAPRLNMSPETAGDVAAVVAPFIFHYAHEKLAAKQ